ncbi:hypothetical protein [Streptomyces avicenniae]|uniref:hypothetical protein n=1 Tax=Streptomyces avicenniae TaxID=500153 RepID=UPI0006996069|nr:hypothetical protein [Streptomyces avicenniae]
MASPDAAFDDAINRILSARYMHMQAAAGAWRALAAAAGAEGSALAGTARATAAEEGVGLLELSDRISAASGWAEGAGQAAVRIADQLQQAADHSARAAEKAIELDDQFFEVEQRLEERIRVIDVGMGVIRASEVATTQKTELKNQALVVLDGLSDEFSRVIGEEPPPAPEGGSGDGGVQNSAAFGGGGAVGAAAAYAANRGGGGRSVASVSGGGGGGARRAGYVAPNGASVGEGDYPGSSVVGPEGGDFAGWVQSPSTGHLVDPATGREFDPSTGQWIDPNTGEGWGAETDYSGRYSGLGNGPGAVAGGAGVIPGLVGGGAALVPGLVGGAGGGNIGGWYGGAVPPSIANAGPARQQMTQQALQNMGRQARVANSLGIHQAAQGGRPYLPPPGASTAGRFGQRPAAGRSGAGGFTQARGGGGTAFPGRAGGVPGGAAAGAARGGMMPPGAAAHGGGQGGRTRGRLGAGRATALRESAGTWRSGVRDVTAGGRLSGRPGGAAAAGAQASVRPGTSGAPGASGTATARAGAAGPSGAAGAGARGAGAAAPPAGAHTGNQRDRDDKARDRNPTELTEDPAVWATDRAATKGVLGE